MALYSDGRAGAGTRGSWAQVWEEQTQTAFTSKISSQQKIKRQTTHLENTSAPWITSQGRETEHIEKTSTNRKKKCKKKDCEEAFHRRNPRARTAGAAHRCCGEDLPQDSPSFWTPQGFLGLQVAAFPTPHPIFPLWGSPCPNVPFLQGHRSPS